MSERLFRKKHAQVPDRRGQAVPTGLGHLPKPVGRERNSLLLSVTVDNIYILKPGAALSVFWFRLVEHSLHTT